MRDACATLPDLWRRISTPVRPRVLAYLLALMFVCLLGLYEVRRIEAYQDNIPQLAPDTNIPRERQTFMPDYDSMRWLVYAQDAWEQGSVRLPHWTYSTGYPDGHFVGWSTPPMWWLDGLAFIRHAVTGEDMLCAIDEVSPFYNTFLWIFATATMGAMCIFALGWRGALVMPLVCAEVFIGIYAYSCDYHLWMILTGIGTMVCLAAPFVNEGRGRVRCWFVGAALFCTLGIWICAPSQALVLIGVFVGFLFAPPETLRKVDSANWRVFGYVTALLTLLAYWWEFRPEFPMNVELNHPVYSMGALVAGLWLWQAHEFIASGWRWDSLSGRSLVYSALAMFAMALPMIVLLPLCFSRADPFRIRWDAMVGDNQPIGVYVLIFMNSIILVAATLGVTGTIINWRKIDGGMRVFLFLVGGNVLVSGYLGVSCFRFFAFSMACVAVFAAMTLPRFRRDWIGWSCALMLLCFVAASLHEKAAETRDTTVYGPNTKFDKYVDARAISDRLLKLDNGAKGAVLAPPDEACIINYYSDLPVLGTGYWEIHPMLVLTSQIFFCKAQDGGRDWANIRAALKPCHLRYIAVSRNIDYKRSYTIYGQEHNSNPALFFAYYLNNVDEQHLVPWLKLAIDDGTFRVFRICDTADQTN